MAGMEGKGEPMTGPSELHHHPIWKSVRLRLWQVLHFWQYYPEFLHWMWEWRMRRCLARDQRNGRKTILAYISIAGHWQFLDALLAEVWKREKEVSVYLAVDEVEAVPRGGFGQVERWKIRPLREFDGVGGFDLFLTPEHNCAYAVSGLKRVCMFHGLQGKGLTFQKKFMKDFDILFLQGPLEERMFEEFADLEPEVTRRQAVYRVGYPKSDVFFHPTRTREEILRGMGLNPRRKTLLYAPSFDKGTSLPQYGENIFRLLSGLDCNVIVKLHPVSYDRRVTSVHSGGIYWPAVVEGYVEKGHFAHAGNGDVADCLMAADAMVTDVSAVALEFMLLDKPVVYIECPEFYAMFSRNGTYTAWDQNPERDLRVNVGRTAGLRVNTLDELRRAIQQALAHPDEMREARQEVVRQSLFHPGEGSARGATFLAEILDGCHGPWSRIRVKRR